MAGKRMLHERICRSEKLARVSLGAEVLYYHLLVLTDDNGNIELDLDLIRSHGFVKRAVTNEEIGKWLRELIDVRADANGGHGLVAEYSDGAKPYLHVMNFEMFQLLRSDRAGKVECPPHPETLGAVRFVSQRVSGGCQLATTGSQVGDTWQPLTGGREVEVKGSKEKKAHPLVRPARDFAFAEFEKKFGRKPAWQTKDFTQLAALFKRRPEITSKQFAAAWRNYLGSTDPFIAKQGYGLAYFCGKFDAFLMGPALAGKAQQEAGTGMSRTELEARKKRRELTPEDEALLRRLKAK